MAPKVTQQLLVQDTTDVAAALIQPTVDIPSSQTTATTATTTMMKKKWSQPTTVATATATVATALVIQLDLFESAILSLLLVVFFTIFSCAVYTLWYYRLPASPHSFFFQNILLGHRGCVKEEFDCTENSISAMRRAVSYPAVNGVEFDVMLSADNVPIVFHDTDRVSRVCKDNPTVQKELELKGSLMGNNAAHCILPKIRNMSLEQIKRYEYRTGPAEERIPTLEEMIAECVRINPTMRMMIELKEFNKPVEMAVAVVQLIARYNLYETSVIGSFNPVVLYHVRRIDPRVVTLLLVRKNLVASWTSRSGVEDHDGPDLTDLGYIGTLASFGCQPLLDWLLYFSKITWLPWFLGAGVIGFHGQLITDGSISISHFQRRGYTINVWVVNDVKEKKHLESVGGIAITTDFLFD